MSLGATNPKDSNGACQAVENSKQYIWKSFLECPYLVLRVCVQREMEDPKTSVVRAYLGVSGQSSGDTSKDKLKIF